MKYPGGKNHGSSYPRIINQIPPHDTFIEPFAGSAAIRRLMRPCKRSILIDLDRSTLAAIAEEVPQGTELLCEDSLAWLKRQAAWLGNSAEAAGVVLYCDPPYLPETCASRMRYKHVLSARDHRQLLELLKGLKCRVLISGYWSLLYAHLLEDWRMIHYYAITRGGTTAEECLWMNYPEPVELHDYRFLGANFRERQDVKRQQKRWATKLAAMSTLKRQALLSVLAEAGPGSLGTDAEADRNGIAADGGRHRRSVIGKAAEPGRRRSTNGRVAER